MRKSRFVPAQYGCPVSRSAVISEPKLVICEQRNPHFVTLAVAQKRPVIKCHHRAVCGPKHADPQDRKIDRIIRRRCNFSWNLFAKQKCVQTVSASASV